MLYSNLKNMADISLTMTHLGPKHVAE